MEKRRIVGDLRLGGRPGRKLEREGRVDLAALKARLGPDVAGVMITNPNTCGLFERDMKAISDAVHAVGGYVYCDGANFNAIVGKVRPGDLGMSCSTPGMPVRCDRDQFILKYLTFG